MIVSFADKNTSVTRNWDPDVQRLVLRRMLLIHAAEEINDLKIPPEIRLHKVNQNLGKYWAISINDNWQVVFKWSDNNAHDVSLTRRLK